jgi:hypothetical protein
MTFSNCCLFVNFIKSPFEDESSQGEGLKLKRRFTWLTNGEELVKNGQKRSLKKGWAETKEISRNSCHVVVVASDTYSLINLLAVGLPKSAEGGIKPLPSWTAPTSGIGDANCNDGNPVKTSSQEKKHMATYGML